MLYNKNNLLVYKVAGNDDARPILEAVKFTPTGTIATDGYKLMIVQTPPDTDTEVFEGLDGLRPNDGNYSPIIDRGTVEKVLKNLPAKVIGDFQWLKGTFFTATSDNEVAELITTDGVNHTKHIAKPIQGDYPDYQKIMPKGKPDIEVGLSIHHLKGIIDTLKSMGLFDTAGTIKLGLYKNEGEEAGKPSLKPVSIEAMTDQGQKVQAVIMPVRLKEE